MSYYRERAMDLFHQGFNCSQAVFAAFCDDLALDFETALKLSSSFGAGMGRMREVCGAVSGMLLVAGMKYGYTDPSDRAAKADHYRFIQSLASQFKENNRSLICRELLGLSGESQSYVPEERNQEYYKKRPCVELVGDAAQIIGDILSRE